MSRETKMQGSNRKWQADIGSNKKSYVKQNYRGKKPLHMTIERKIEVMPPAKGRFFFYSKTNMKTNLMVLILIPLNTMKI
jgi:hypothetical protein